MQNVHFEKPNFGDENNVPVDRKMSRESQTVSTKCTIVSATSTTLVRSTVAH